MNPTDDDVRRPACEAVRPLIEQFAERTLTADDATVMRKHIVSCKDCAERYRTAVESAGRSGAAAREARERRETEADRVRRVRESVEGQVEPKRHRNLRLRTMLMPAFFAFLIFQIFKAQDRGPRFVVDGAIGNVEVTGRPYAAYGRNEVVMRRGARCVTGKNSSAHMLVEGHVYRLGADSELLVIDFDPPRARLFAGDLRVSGTCVIETLIGNVLVTGDDAAGELLFDASGLLLTADAGRWIFQNAQGEETIAVGQHRRFRP